MKAVKFTLSGKNAFFKKPEVNTYYYFTFGQIHKVNEAFVFSSGGSRLLCDNGIHEWCQDAGFWRDRRL